jgi:hypothetical protein
MLVAELDEVVYDLEVDGEEVRRQLHRRVWEQRGWATVAIVYQEKDRDGTWKPAKLALIRMQKVREAWKRHAAITLDGDAALALGASIESWRPDLGG